MPKFLVTGGAGFIGSNLAIALAREGHDVTVVDRFLHSHPAPALRDFTGEVVIQDVAEKFEAAPGYDAIFHQAALTDPRYANDDEIVRQNLQGFQNILDYCLKNHTRLVFASTAGLYGNGPSPMKEDQPKDLLTAYGRSKLAIDEKAAQYWDKLPMVGLRYFNVFGPREAHKGRPASMILHLRRQILAGEPARLFKFGEHRRDFIYVDDVVRANLCALTAPSGVYNVGTGIGTTFNELVHILNDVLKKNAPIEYFDMPFDARTYQDNTVADLTLARERLGFTPKWDIKAAIADYMDWIAHEESRA